ncbi:hypothetical protein AB205_0084930, partial [Aquarana catesbeiana]
MEHFMVQRLTSRFRMPWAATISVPPFNLTFSSPSASTSHT